MQALRLIRTVIAEAAGGAEITGTHEPNSRQDDRRAIRQPANNEPQQLLEGSLLGNIQSQVVTHENGTIDEVRIVGEVAA